MELPSLEQFRAAQIERELNRMSADPERVTYDRIEAHPVTRVSIWNRLGVVITEHDVSANLSAAIMGHDVFQHPDTYDDVTRLGVPRP